MEGAVPGLLGVLHPSLDAPARAPLGVHPQLGLLGLGLGLGLGLAAVPGLLDQVEARGGLGRFAGVENAVKLPGLKIEQEQGGLPFDSLQGLEHGHG